MNAVFAESKLGLMNDNISNINYLRIFVGITPWGARDSYFTNHWQIIK